MQWCILHITEPIEDIVARSKLWTTDVQTEQLTKDACTALGRRESNERVIKRQCKRYMGDKILVLPQHIAWTANVFTSVRQTIATVYNHVHENMIKYWEVMQYFC